MVRSLVIALLVLCLWPAIISAETPAQYREALAETEAAVEAALSMLPEDTSLTEYQPLEFGLRRLESISAVTTDSGETQPVDNSLLIKRFSDSRKDGEQAYESLRQLILEIDSSTGRTLVVDYGDARVSLEEVFKRAEFGNSTSNPVGRFFDDLRNRFYEWINGLIPDFSFPKIPGLDLDGPVTVIFWLVAGALAIFSVIFLTFTFLNSRPRLARYAAVTVGKGPDREDSRTARLAAQTAADKDDYRLAIHYLFLWTVLHLAEQAQLHYDRSLTNREQIRALATSAEVADHMLTAVETFDRLWYGHAACTETEYGQFRITVERIVGVSV